MPDTKHLHVFLSSSVDVQEERRFALEFFKDKLPDNRFTFDVISWDDPNTSVPFEADLTPQEIVNLRRRKPSECDIVIVILRVRMGTPLSSEDGTGFQFGTEWEYEDALKSKTTGGKTKHILVYWRQEPPKIDPTLSDKEIDAQQKQYQQVEAFIARFRNADGSFVGSFNPYDTPEDFADMLEEHILRLLDSKRAIPLAHGLASRITRFEDEYLIGESGPVPFGGRQTQLDYLDAWLMDENADPRLLVSAPAGRGKSALLVRWMHSLKQREHIVPNKWQLVFVPVSIRFGTNAPDVHFRLLAEQLAAIASVTLEVPITDPAGFYADQSRELLQQLAEDGVRTLVVLDGLDEALREGTFDTLFPRNPPETLRFLVAARWLAGDHNGEGWLRRLDWPLSHPCNGQHLELPPLTNPQIADVLISMGAPVDLIGKDQVLVHRLAELTEGEPLLLRYYAEDLWRKTSDGTAITMADLDHLKPGFGAYFQRWLELQEEHWRSAGENIDRDTIDAALAVLAFAKGPLEAKDMLVLIKATSPAVTCPRRAKSLLWPLRRFVVGDGSRVTPYVLSHPKLGAYLREETFRDQADEIGQGFAAWGQEHVRSLNNGQLSPEQASPYALQFIAQHFGDAQLHAADFMMLVEDGWRRAWEHFEGGQRGFSSDVRVAWSRQRSDDIVGNLGAQWRCALTLSSIKSLGYSIPYELIIRCVKEGVLSARQGQHFAELMADDSASVMTSVQLARLSSANAVLSAELAFAAVQLAKAAHDPSSRVDSFGILLDNLLLPSTNFHPALHESIITEVRPAVLTEALAATKTIADEEDRSEALGELAPHLPTSLLKEFLAAVLDTIPMLRRDRALSLTTATLSNIIASGGTATAEDIRKAINDVSQWYP